jgi:hypothetical protein
MAVHLERNALQMEAARRSGMTNDHGSLPARLPLRCERAFYFDANRTNLLYASEGK